MPPAPPRSASPARRAPELNARWEPGHSRAGAAKIREQAARRAAHQRGRGSGPSPTGSSAPSRCCPTAASPTPPWRGTAAAGSASRPGRPRRARSPRSPVVPWQNIPSALTILPSWAISGRIWAADLVEFDGLWHLYFSAEVAGLGLDGRCIGVATATDPTQSFVPDERPLVCPKQAVSPPAYDKVKRRGRDLPKAGVIDPDFFQDRGGHRYLLYRTQSTPSTIRLVQLPAERPAGRPAGAQHRAGPARRRDREPGPAPARPSVRAHHLRGRVRRVQLQDDLPPLRQAHGLVEGEAAGAGRHRQERAVRARRRRPGPRGGRRAAAVLPRVDLPRGGRQLPGRAQLRPRQRLRRAPLAVRRPAAVHQPAVAADQGVRRADPAASAAADHRSADHHSTDDPDVARDGPGPAADRRQSSESADSSSDGEASPDGDASPEGWPVAPPSGSSGT